MAKKDPSWIWIIVIIALVLFVYKQGGFNFNLQSILPTATYNGDMEAWCIRAPTDVGKGYGFYDPGTGITTTRCDTANSVSVLSPSYDGTHNQNEVPALWALNYGCCTKRASGTADVHSGLYAVQIHKESTDDWYFFGQDRRFGIPVIGGKVYTLNVWYKLIKNAADVRFSLVMHFDDVNGIEISSGKQSKEFPAASVYTPLNISTTAPLNAAKIYWTIQVNQFAVGDLYLDDITIDETGCIPDSTINCGVDTGACSYGTQTCNSIGVWGSCIGAVGPITEVCGDTIDNDCDGPVDEGCSFTPYTRNEYIAEFDLADAATYNHTALSTKNSPTWWAWDNSPIVEAQLNMYSTTGATKYLDYVVANNDLLISKAGDGNGDGLKDWQNLESPIDPILTYSRTLLPMVKFAYIVKKAGLTQYYAKADSYISFVENNFIPVYDLIWKECGTMGFWSEGTASAPNNRASFVGRIHVYLYLINGNAKYLDRATKYATKVKSTLLERTDGPTGAPYYFWNYANRAGCTTVGTSYSCTYSCPIEGRTTCNTNPGDWVCSGPLELSYGNYDVLGMVNYYQAGIVFTSSDITKLQNTFKEGFLVENAEVEGVPNPVLRWNANPAGPPTSAGYYGITAGAHDWAILGQYDTTIKTVFDKINKNILEDAAAEGTYYNHPYVCVTDMRDLTKTPYCIPTTDPQWNGDYRSTPAYQLSRIGWQLTSAETLTPLILQEPVCGDGVIEGSEACDGTNLNGQSCVSLDYQSGTLSCGTNCQFITSSCVAITPPQCGNNLIESGEVCDGTALQQTCQGLGFSSGTLSCNSGCTGYVTSSCTNAGTCGNGVIDTGELCDSGNLAGKTCQNLGYTGGALTCNSNCFSYDASACFISQTQCTSYWQCGAYGACVNGVQSRTCDDVNNCPVANSFPQLSTVCSTTSTTGTTPPSNPNLVYYIIAGVAVAALTGGAAWIKLH